MDERIKYLYIAFLKHKTTTLMTHPYYRDESRPEVPVYYEWDHPHNGDPNYSVLFNLGDPPGTWARNLRDRGRYSMAPGGWCRVPDGPKFK